MSSLWTPEGERPVGRPTVPPSAAPPGPPPDGPPGDPGDPGEPSDEEIDALRAQLAQTPAAVIVVNHCFGLFELAALHLSLQPPQLDQAAVAIDALGAVIERLAGRLGDDEPTLIDALAQIRLAFVQVRGATQEASANG